MQPRIVQTSDLKRLQKELRTVADGKQLRKELTGGIRSAMAPVAPLVKAAYLGQAGHKGKRSRGRARQPNLRTLLANATRIEVRTTGKQAGARIRVDGRKMPAGMKALPRYWEGEKRPWRWPVYPGRSDRTRTTTFDARWAQGRARPTFDRTVEPHSPQVRREVDEMFERVRKKLEGAT
jgi:hypothetical protein